MSVPGKDCFLMFAESEKALGPGSPGPKDAFWHRLFIEELQYIEDLEVPGSYYSTTQAAPGGLNGSQF